MTEHEQPVVRDKRRVRFDPVAGAVPGTPAAGSSPPSTESQMPPTDGKEGEELRAENARLQALVAERTSDLQRLQAEYANYRKRVERDRALVRDRAVADALSALLPVLDDIGRARAHGELEGGFKQVAEALEAAVAKLGLVAFGDVGDPFDPTRHEALMHSYSDEVSQPTVVEVFAPGYTYAGLLVRPARVAVAEPTVALPEAPQGGSESPATGGSPASGGEPNTQQPLSEGQET